MDQDVCFFLYSVAILKQGWFILEIIDKDYSYIFYIFIINFIVKKIQPRLEGYLFHIDDSCLQCNTLMHDLP